MSDILAGIIVCVALAIFAVCFSAGVESLGKSFKELGERK